SPMVLLRRRLRLLPYTTLFRSRARSTSGSFSWLLSLFFQRDGNTCSLARGHGCTVRASPLPTWLADPAIWFSCTTPSNPRKAPRSEEHTSELQSRENLVCRLLL